MAYELSVNLEYMYQEAGEKIEDRIAAAAADGYRKVEIFSMTGRDAEAAKQALTSHGVELISMVNDPRTLLVDPNTHEQFRAIFRKTCEDAVFLGCQRVVVASGPGVPYQKRPVQLATVAQAVSSIVPIAESFGVTIMLEPVNTRVDHPGVLFSHTEDAVAVIEMVNSPRVRLLYDLYHSVTEGEDPAEVLPPIAHLLEHVQVADAPGRGEPGSGKIDWEAALNLLHSVGYSGPIGVECSPTRAPTGEALKWFSTLVDRG